ncbi:MAG TPA: Hpt domain-containing protein [Anaerovoracaceae bacterium]|nr:Hpt domain-containing protein [Anaerovoracaceae bacterium]
MGKRIENLRDYGIDFEEVMKRFVNDEAFYLECLDMFFQDDSMERLKESIEKKDTNAAFEAAHTLKGIVGNLGLKKLFEKVSMLVEELRLNKFDNANSMYQEIRSEYEVIKQL